MTRLPIKEKRRLDSLIFDLESAENPTKEQVGYLCKETLRIYYQYNDRDYLEMVSKLAWNYEHLYR